MWKKPSKTKEPKNLEKAYEYAVFLLSLTLQTVGEVKMKMDRRGYAENIIDKTIERLKEQKYLDDQRYAEVYLENLKKYKTFGFYGIKKKLMEKKIPSNIIEQVLNEGLSEQEELKIAKRLLKKGGAIIKPSADDILPADEPRYNVYNEEESKEKQKTSQKLKSRGFRGSVIARV